MAARVREEAGPGFTVTRAASTVVLAGLVLVIPFEASTTGRVLGAILVLLSIPVTALAERMLTPGRSDLIANTSAAFLTIALTIAIPALWVAGVVTLSIIGVSALPVQSRTIGLGQVYVWLVALSIIGWANSVERWWIPILAVAALVPAIERYYREWRLSHEETSRRYDTLVETAGLFFWEVDPVDLRIVSLTGNTIGPIGRSTKAVQEMNWADVVSDRARFDDALDASHADQTGDGVFAVFDLTHADGSAIPFRHRLRIDPDTGFVQGAAMEITELALATRLIRHQAEHDGLTGLITRNVLTNRLSTLLDGCSEAEPVAVLMVDLNRFKEVNDVLGHRVGDAVLAILARRFEQLDFIDGVARLGGDEFAFLLSGEQARNAKLHSEEIVDTIEELVQVDRLKLSVSASVGVATAPFDGTTTDILVARADTAMYRAKKTAERCVAFSESQGARVGEQVALSAELERAIASGQIELWFQPQIDLATERVIGAEGLARWRHPELGLLTPDRFLPLLAVSGTYETFTDEVIRQGIEFAQRTRAQGAPITAAINLSAMSFFDHGLAARVQQMLAATGVSASQLVFEITESDILEDMSVHGPVFDSLTDLGIELAIDDFGVGYSSLSRLRKLPVHELKIDRSFVMGMVTDPEDLIIVKAVVDMASVLGHRSIAEGVETTAALDRLREMGCDVVQGYLFGKPMPANEFFDRFSAHDGVRRIVLDASTN